MVETGANDNSPALFQCIQQRRDVRGVVLTVGIDLHNSVVIVPLGETEGSTHGPSNTNVEGHPQYSGTRLMCGQRGGVRGRVIHHQDIRLDSLPDLCHDSSDGFRLVQSGHRDQDSHGLHTATSHLRIDLTTGAPHDTDTFTG